MEICRVCRRVAPLGAALVLALFVLAGTAGAEAANVALVEFGTEVAVDSCFMQYNEKPLNDGERNDASEVGRWNEVAWASAETDQDHWVMLTFPAAQPIHRIDIYWARDTGVFWRSENYQVDIWQDGKWVNISSEEQVGPKDKYSRFEFSPVKTRRVRIFQPAGGGPTARPNLMWIAEIEVFSNSPVAGATEEEGPAPKKTLASQRMVSESNPFFLNWKRVRGASAYQLQYSRTKDFVPEQTVTVSGILANFYMPRKPLEAGTWYWRVAPVRGSSVGEYSAASEVVIPETAVRFAVPKATRSAPYGHPRLYINRDQVARLREQAEGEKKAWWERIVQNATPRDLISEPDEFRSGWNLGQWQKIVQAGGAVQNAIILPAFAYLISGDEAYASEAKKWMLAVADWDPEGSTGIRSVDHAARDILHSLALGYDWLYFELSATEREKVRQAITARARSMYEFLNPFTGDPHNNHPWFNTAALADAALVLLEIEPQAREWLDFAVQLYVGRFLALGGRDGDWHEGVDYWTYTLGYVFDFADSVLATAGIDLYQHPFLKSAADFKLYTHSPDSEGLSFGDTHRERPHAEDATAMMRLASMYGDERAQWYAVMSEPETYQGLMLVRQFLWFDPEVEPKPPLDLSPSRLFRDCGWAILRTNLDDSEGISFALKSGPYNGRGAGHNHADQNSFILSAYGKPLAIDSGYYDSYGSPHFKEWYIQTKAHNTILVDGRGQAVHQAGADGKIEQFVTGGAYDYVVGDASAQAIYKGALDKFKRHVVFVRPDFFVLYDDLKAAEESTFDWLLHAVNRPLVRGNGTNVTLMNEGANLRVQFVKPDKLLSGLNSGYAIPPQGRNPDDWHLKLSTTEARKEQQFVAVMTPFKTGRASKVPEAELIESDDLIGVQANFPFRETGKDIVLFRKGEQEGERGLAGLSSDGAVFAVGIGQNGEVARYMVVDGTRLSYDGKSLLTASKPVSVLAEASSTSLSIVIEGSDETTVTLQEAPAGGIFIDGKLADLSAVGQALKLKLSAGRHTVEVGKRAIAAGTPLSAEKLPTARIVDPDGNLVENLQPAGYYRGEDAILYEVLVPGPAGLYDVAARYEDLPGRQEFSVATGRNFLGQSWQANRDDGKQYDQHFTDLELGPYSLLRIYVSGHQPASALKEIELVLTAKAGAAPISSAEPVPTKMIADLDLEGAVIIEAEDLVAEGGGQSKVDPGKVNASGAAVKDWGPKGHWLAWEFEAPTSGKYQLVLKACTIYPEVVRDVTIDGEYLVPGEVENISFARTGGWSNSSDDWRLFRVSDPQGEPLILELEEGMHRLRMVSVVDYLNLDFIALVPVTP